MSEIALMELGHRYAGEESWLFRRLSATFRSGEKIAITGPSGSGKSTLLSIIAQTTPPVEGNITWLGIQRVQWVFQNPHGVPQRAAIDHVALPFLARGASPAEADERAQILCRRVGLGHVVDGRSFATLSGGEAQRILLACALAAEPDLLLVDEPTAQLDRTSAETVNRILHQLQVRGTILVIATHDSATVESCDRVVDLAAVLHESQPGSVT